MAISLFLALLYAMPTWAGVSLAVKPVSLSPDFEIGAPASVAQPVGAFTKTEIIKIPDGSEVYEACNSTTNSIPETVKKYCASSKFGRYFWQQAKGDLQKKGSLTPDLAKALDSENPCLGYYEALVKAKQKVKADHAKQCEALRSKAQQADAACKSAKSCLTETSSLMSQAEQAQKKYAHDFADYHSRVQEFEQGNAAFQTHVKKEITAFSAMPSPQKLQKESNISEALSLDKLRGLDAAGKAVMAGTGSTKPNDSFRVDAARTGSSSLTQHKQRLQEMSQNALQVQKELKKEKTAASQEKSQAEKSATALEKNKAATDAGGANLSSLSGLAGAAASALGGKKSGGGNSSPSTPTAAPSFDSASVSSPSGMKSASAVDTAPVVEKEKDDASSASSLKSTIQAASEAMDDRKPEKVKSESLKEKLAKLSASESQSGGDTGLAGAAASGSSKKPEEKSVEAPWSAGHDSSPVGSGGGGGGYGGSSYSDDHSAPVSLANSETDAQVKKMIGELDPSHGHQAEAAALEINNEISLFTRVTSTYKKITKRGL